MSSESYSWKEVGYVKLNKTRIALLVFLNDGKTLSFYVEDLLDLASNAISWAKVFEGVKNVEVRAEAKTK
jgi:hypothetical protein